MVKSEEGRQGQGVLWGRAGVLRVEGAVWRLQLLLNWYGDSGSAVGGEECGGEQAQALCWELDPVMVNESVYM